MHCMLTSMSRSSDQPTCAVQMAEKGSDIRRTPSYPASLAAGALSGLSVDLLFYPIDTLKTRLQSSQGFLQAGGFSGIYRGIGSVAVGSAPGAACFFVAYESLKPWLRTQLEGQASSSTLDAGIHMAAASMAEIAACLIRVPTEVVKSRQQTSTYGQKVTSLHALRSVVREQGARGLYVGFAGTIGREVGVLFSFYRVNTCSSSLCTPARYPSPVSNSHSTNV